LIDHPKQELRSCFKFDDIVQHFRSTRLLQVFRTSPKQEFIEVEGQSWVWTKSPIVLTWLSWCFLKFTLPQDTGAIDSDARLFHTGYFCPKWDQRAGMNRDNTRKLADESQIVKPCRVMIERTHS
jgi:hypothetical protein